MHFSIFGAFSSCISAATSPLACSSFDFLLPCTAASQLQVQQRNLCVAAIFFFILFFFQGGDLYSHLGLHKLISYSVLQTSG